MRRDVGVDRFRARHIALQAPVSVGIVVQLELVALGGDVLGFANGARVVQVHLFRRQAHDFVDGVIDLGGAKRGIGGEHPIASLALQ